MPAHEILYLPSRRSCKQDYVAYLTAIGTYRSKEEPRQLSIAPATRFWVDRKTTVRHKWIQNHCMVRKLKNELPQCFVTDNDGAL